MSKKRSDEREESAAGKTPEQSLGEYLANIRAVRKLTLRQVEEATDGDVSNAYLSQLETNKISKPSPNVLHSLAKVYVVPYETLMEKAGWFVPPAAPAEELRSGKPAKHGRAATFATENLTKEEEEKLLEYLAFLRSRRSRGEKT